MRWSRATTMTAIKLAGFAVACLVVTAWLVVRIGNFQLFTSDVGYHAVLQDATGLTSGDMVKVSGVTVGRVNSVTVRHGHAYVAFDLSPKVRLRSTSGVGLQWLDVIGDKVLYIYPGSTGRVLPPGATLPLRNDVADASVGQLLNTLGPFLQAINPREQNAFLQAVSSALQGNNAEVHALIHHTAAVSSTVGSVSGELGSLIDNLSTVVGAIARHRQDVGALAARLASLSSDLKANNGLLDGTVGNLGQAEKDFARLLKSNSGNLDSLIVNLKGIASDLDAHRRSLIESLHTLPAGLAPYQEISSYGQWFEIDTVFTCIANQTVCSYQQPTNAPGGSTNPFPGGPPPASGLGGFYGALAGGGG